MERILIIDDDEELCELVGQFLEPEGFSAEAAADGAAGLERAKSGWGTSRTRTAPTKP